MNGLLFAGADSITIIALLSTSRLGGGLQITLTKHKSQELLTHKINRRSLEQGRILWLGQITETGYVYKPTFRGCIDIM